MSTAPTRRARLCGDDTGGISLFVIATAVAVILAAGLAADGGVKLRAARQASAIAEEAARAGAGQIDKNTLYAEGGDWQVSPQDAVEAANAYLDQAGQPGEVAITGGGQSVQVTVTITEPTLILQMVGIGEVTVTKTAEADLVQGVNGPQQ